MIKLFLGKLALYLLATNKKRINKVYSKLQLRHTQVLTLSLFQLVKA